jgi:hypothetical protein
VVADSSLTDPASYADPDRTVAEEPGFVQADANTATSAQLVTAFETNGIADAATWAAEVIGHRPYSTTALDPFEDLRVTLIAAGLDELTAGAVVASLTV